MTSTGLKDKSNRFRILLATTAASVAATIYVSFILSKSIPYTHLFYIPIVLAGMWYQKRAVYVALFLGMIYILATHFSPLPMDQFIFGRSIVFVAIGYTIGLISKRRAENEEALRVSEEKYRNLIDQSQDVIYVLYEGKFELINSKFEELLGYTLEEVNAPDFHFINLVAAESRVLVEERAEKVLRGGTVPPRYEFTALTRDGIEIEVETSVSYIPYKGNIAAQGILRDITERKRAERRIEHLNLVLRAIRNVNQLITREKDRDRLLKGACEALIETRGYDHSWVAMLDKSGGLVSWAEASFGESFLPFADDLRRGELPVSAQKALAHSDVVVTRVPSLDCAGYPLAEEHPGRIVMHARLAHAGKVYGVLSGSFPEDLDIGEEELTLFEEVACDIALALHAIELEEEHRQAQERLRESEEKHRTILEHIEEGYYEVDLRGNLTFFNDSLCKMFGYPADKLLGMNNRQYTDEENARKMYQAFNHVYRTGKTAKAFDWEIIRKDGTKRFVEASASLISDPADQPTGFRGIVRDITERKRMQREIEGQREYLASVLRSAPDAIITLDRAHRVLEWNPGATRLFGYAYGEVVGKDIDDVVARPDVKQQATLFTNQVLSRKKIPPTEVIRYRKDDAPVSVILACSPILIGDELRGAVAVYTDITERKRVEEALQQAHDMLETRVEQRTADLKRANKLLRDEITQRKQATEQLRAKEMQLIHAGRLSSLGEMATGVAHEINQPLAIISLAAEGRLRDIERGRFDVSILPQELKDILKNVRRIDRIITHMRTFARRTGELESVEPEEMLDNVFILLGEQLRIHEISISREVEKGLPAVKIDANQLEQVFVNILVNARQALDDKGEEAQREGNIFAKRLVCGISRYREEEHEYVVFEFADNAYGVPDELKLRVFDPFLTTKEPGQGTGLGLSITYSIVTSALGGKIWVEDNEMGGASFKVALPLGETPCASTS